MKLRKTWKILSVTTMLAGLALAGDACTGKADFSTPDGVMTLAELALAANQFDDFAETLTADAYTQYGDPSRSGDHSGFESLRRRMLEQGKVTVSSPEFTGKDTSWNLEYSHYRMTVSTSPESPGQAPRALAEAKISCWHDIVHSVYAYPRETCKIAELKAL